MNATFVTIDIYLLILQPISLDGDFCAEFDGETARLIIKHVYPEDEGEYTCVASNELGKAYTSACLIVDGNFTIIYFNKFLYHKNAHMWSFIHVLMTFNMHQIVRNLPSLRGKEMFKNCTFKWFHPCISGGNEFKR